WMFRKVGYRRSGGRIIGEDFATNIINRRLANVTIRSEYRNGFPCRSPVIERQRGRAVVRHNLSHHRKVLRNVLAGSNRVVSEKGNKRNYKCSSRSRDRDCV